jgi:predicted hydrocarbon binding protein
MVVEKKVEFEIDHRFDPVRNRHYLNGFCSVLHCHHYATLYTQLADDAVDFEGIKHLIAAAEETFYEVLDDYYTRKGVDNIEDKVSIAEQFWAAVGMGRITFTGVGKYAAYAEMEFSHVDNGWLSKWGSRERPVNFFTSGFVAAVVALVNNKNPRSYVVKEIKSLVRGDEVSTFKASLG